MCPRENRRYRTTRSCGGCASIQTQPSRPQRSGTCSRCPLRGFVVDSQIWRIGASCAEKSPRQEQSYGGSQRISARRRVRRSTRCRLPLPSTEPSVFQASSLQGGRSRRVYSFDGARLRSSPLTARRFPPARRLDLLIGRIWRVYPAPLSPGLGLLARLGYCFPGVSKPRPVSSVLCKRLSGWPLQVTAMAQQAASSPAKLATANMARPPAGSGETDMRTHATCHQESGGNPATDGGIAA